MKQHAPLARNDTHKCMSCDSARQLDDAPDRLSKRPRTSAPNGSPAFSLQTTAAGFIAKSSSIQALGAEEDAVQGQVAVGA